MTPRKKAKELVTYYDEVLEDGCVSFISGLPSLLSLKVVDEILNNSVLNYSGSDFSDNEILSDTEYWESVKKEIELI